MRTQNINRTDAEKFWGVFSNTGASLISEGLNCHLATNTASNDGNQISSIVTANTFAFVGIADEQIAAAGVGLVQTYGYNSKILIYSEASSTITHIGDVCGPVDATSEGIGSGGSVDTFGPIICMSTAVHGTAPDQKMTGFIRCM